MRTYVWPHRWSLAAGAFFLVLTNWIAVSIPGHIGGAIDGLVAGQTDAIGAHTAWIIGLGVLVIGVRTLSRVLFFNPGRDVEYALRQDLFAHLLALRPSFYTGRRTGDIVSRASSDITFVRVMVGFGSLQLINVALAVTLTGWKMTAISPRLTLLALAPVVLGLAAVQLGIQAVFDLAKKEQTQLGDISDHVLGSFHGISSIQGFVAEPAFEERFAQRNAGWFATAMRLTVVRSLLFPLLYVTGGLAVFVLLYVGGPMAVRGELTVGDLAAFTTLLVALLPPLRSMGWMLSVVQRGQASMERIFELLDAPVDRPELDRAAPPVSVAPTGRGPGFRLRDLGFAYPDAPDRPALRGLTVDIPPGASVGIFGRTGSGKSTLVRLLSRVHDPPPGQLMVVEPGVDGAAPQFDDIRHHDLHAWRRRMAVAPQRPFLFSDTIASNVALDDTPDAARLRKAVSLAALEPDLAAFPKGLDTMVGQRGVMLSGGQRQRVALARSLYRDADVLVLDDVLSAVDHETEARLVSSLGALGGTGGGPTVFIVSHRLSAIQHCDLILVLEDGALVDAGTHAELAARPGRYRETWLVQGNDGAPVEPAP